MCFLLQCDFDSSPRKTNEGRKTEYWIHRILDPSLCLRICQARTVKRWGGASVIRQLELTGRIPTTKLCTPRRFSIRCIIFFENPAINTGITGNFSGDTRCPYNLEFRVRFRGYGETYARKQGRKVGFIGRCRAKGVYVNLIEVNKVFGVENNK
jgi:hypothetical protein